MKFTSCIVLSLLLNTAKAASFTPFRLSYDSLVNTPLTESDSLMQALTTDGILSVTGLPKSAKEAAVTMASSQHACLLETKNKEEQVFADGTLRRTVATHTVAGAGGMQPLAVDKTLACETFEAASVIFRKTTQVAVQAFAKHVTQGLPVQDGRPLLMTSGSKERGEEPFAFPTFADVVVNGDHLEHFHSYQKFESSSSKKVSTIDVHTDQGLFLVFTPGHLSNGELTKGFYIQTANDELEEVTFDAQDDLVFLLGDGVNQVVNDMVVGNNKLRSVPHALQLEASNDLEQARVWYGLMVLPPSSAVHPAYDGITFGEIRQGLIEGQNDVIQLACSSTSDQTQVSAVHSTPRWLSEAGASSIPTCNYTEEVYCWHRCMNATEMDLTVATCTSEGATLQCMNPRGQVSDGDKHGDFFPACATSDAVNVTEFPQLPNYPRNDTLCQDFALVYDNDPAYTHTITLPGGKGGLFQFSLVDDVLKARLAFNGIFGYLAVGFVGPEYPERNAMYGGKIIMAMRGGNYTPVEGLDLDMAPVVEEFVMSNESFSFRFWSEPYGDAADMIGDVTDAATATSRGAGRRLSKESYKVETAGEDCYTALTFEVHDIGGQEFNLTGTDTFMWAANDVDTHMQYHMQNQGIFNITWSELTTADEPLSSGKSASAVTTAVGALSIAVLAAASVL